MWEKDLPKYVFKNIMLKVQKNILVDSNILDSTISLIVSVMVTIHLLLKDLTIGKKNAVTFTENLMNQATHIGNIILRLTQFVGRHSKLVLYKEMMKHLIPKIEFGSIFVVKLGIYTFVSWLMSHDMSLKRENEHRIIHEMFLDLVHLSLTLKTNMWRQLAHCQFDVSKIYGPDFDDASNMGGEWNEL
uniref:Uncharacterized protein n=1 Tax=Lactuca sativa TaxID=4236 RepID=A0A9R1V5X0_LACSA|nr:hypothetical protein LSAT_V11C600332810 [Lactuca sativa]